MAKRLLANIAKCWRDLLDVGVRSVGASEPVQRDKDLDKVTVLYI